MARVRLTGPTASFAAAAALVAALAVLALAERAGAATTTTVVDLPTRDATLRFLYLRPDAPVANIVFLPGNDGALGIADDGSMPTLTGRCGPFARGREAFARRGFALALVDRSSDGRTGEYDDVLAVVRYIRARDGVPTWIAGGSGSTPKVLDFAAAYPRGEPLGVIIFSPGGTDFPRAGTDTRPTLLVYHELDAKAKAGSARLFGALTSAPVKERIGLDGGGGGSECGGHHLFMGIDVKFVETVSGFIDRHRAMPR